MVIGKYVVYKLEELGFYSKSRKYSEQPSEKTDCFGGLVNE